MAKKDTIELLKLLSQSDYEDEQLWVKLSNSDINLKTYQYLKKEDRAEIITSLKALNSDHERVSYLVNNQIPCNKNKEIFDATVNDMVDELENYVTYHAFKLINAHGSIEDYKQDLFCKFFYMSNFYKDRWFNKDKFIVDKEKNLYSTKVVYKPMLYKEFLWLAKATISGERRLKAYKFTKDPESSVNKVSLNQLAYNKKSDNKRLIKEDLISVDCDAADSTNYRQILQKANAFLDSLDGFDCSKKKVKNMLIDNKIKGNKVENILLKVSLYKAGLSESTKVLTFVNHLSNKYKERFGISQSLLDQQLVRSKQIDKRNKRLNSQLAQADLEYKYRLLEDRLSKEDIDNLDDEE